MALLVTSLGAHDAATVRRPCGSERQTARRVWLTFATRALRAAVACPVILQGPALANPAAASFYDHFAGMPLTDQVGRPLRLTSLRGKLVLFNFIYTACSTVCRVQTHALARMLTQMPPALRARVHLVSVSLDPLSDTPRTLASFAKRYQADFANWSFVTGKPDDIERLARTLALFRNGVAKAPLDDHATSL